MESNIYQADQLLADTMTELQTEKDCRDIGAAEKGIFLRFLGSITYHNVHQRLELNSCVGGVGGV